LTAIVQVRSSHAPTSGLDGRQSFRAESGCKERGHEIRMAKQAHFTPALFTFLRDLQANNERAWFEANKERYLREVRTPLQAFVSDFGPRLAGISSRFVADPRPLGGSIFRIYRDTRFSKDKSPYKTMAAAQFRHEQAKTVHAPGFYLHLEPGQVFAGAGLWHPERDSLDKVRCALVAHPERWKRTVRAPAFRRVLSFAGDSLARTPRGFPADHELADDLKRTDFVVVAQFSESDACGSAFLNEFAKVCRTSAPFMELLTRALGLRW
jgi:uncharacterized protein (TIGR02453 family)